MNKQQIEAKINLLNDATQSQIAKDLVALIPALEHDSLFRIEIAPAYMTISKELRKELKFVNNAGYRERRCHIPAIQLRVTVVDSFYDDIDNHDYEDYIRIIKEVKYPIYQKLYEKELVIDYMERIIKDIINNFICPLVKSLNLPSNFKVFRLDKEYDGDYRFNGEYDYNYVLNLDKEYLKDKATESKKYPGNEEYLTIFNTDITKRIGHKLLCFNVGRDYSNRLKVSSTDEYDTHLWLQTYSVGDHDHSSYSLPMKVVEELFDVNALLKEAKSKSYGVPESVGEFITNALNPKDISSEEEEEDSEEECSNCSGCQYSNGMQVF